MRLLCALCAAAALLGCNFGPSPAKLGQACGNVGGSTVQTDCESGGVCVSSNGLEPGTCAGPCPTTGQCATGSGCSIWFRLLAPDAGLGIPVCPFADGG